MEINLNKEEQARKQCFRVERELNRQLMQMLEEDFLSWVKDGYLLPIFHFFYNVFGNGRYALTLKNSEGKIWITGAYYENKASRDLSYATSDIQLLDNYTLAKVVDAVRYAKEHGTETPVRIDEYKYPKSLGYTMAY